MATQIGLDIGGGGVRAVETLRRRDHQVIVNYGQAPLPAGAVQSGIIRDERAVTHALRQMWSAVRFRGRRVVLGVTNPQVVVREMSIANLPPKELRKSLPYQVRDALPLPVDNALLDFYPLDEPGTDGTVRGLLIAAPKDPVLAAVRATEKAGLRVGQVDLGVFALLRSSAYLDDKVEALVDIGEDITSVVVHAAGQPLIVRTVPRGGGEITQTVATRLGVTIPEAETLKRRVGMNADEGPETAEAVRDAVRPLINEIRSSFTYLRSGDRHTEVQRLALTGGGALLPGLSAELADQLALEVTLADAAARVRSPRRGRHDALERYRSAAAVSIGLTLGAAR
ncbi:MAG TPA: type IV pilus assembly protein PilM [Micromonosporaceae bacterium]|nr:type IV pilus assembly protein PilM [Micromonosporaceae bacterium]